MPNPPAGSAAVSGARERLCEPDEVGQDCSQLAAVGSAAQQERPDAGQATEEVVFGEACGVRLVDPVVCGGDTVAGDFGDDVVEAVQLLAYRLLPAAVRCRT